VLFLFFDGVGIGPQDGSVNPFFRADLPTLSAALGGSLPSLTHPDPAGALGRAFPLDACLGVEGLPQSGTGQIALLTGRNAPRILGRHFGPWPPVRLRPLLHQENFLSRAVARGARVRFANAYPPGYPERVHSRRVAAPSVAARSAGLSFPGPTALLQGDAVASEIVNDAWRSFLGFPEVPPVSPEGAGAHLAAIAENSDLTFFAHYRTDHVGHEGDLSDAVEALRLLDRFLLGILRSRPPGVTVVIASDHGNLEDVRLGHTRNPALGAVLGRTLPDSAIPTDLTGVADLVLDLLGGSGREERPTSSSSS